MDQTKKQFNCPNQILAIAASSLGQLFGQSVMSDKFRVEGNVAVVDIVGPILHHSDFFFQSYDSIKENVKAALDSNNKSVLLNIDSPGGMVDGLYDTVTELCALAKKANKELNVYVDSTMCSAAYILGTVGKIFCPPTGVVGSIGLIEQFHTETALDSAKGMQYHTITSGARKADKNPHVAATDEMLSVAQVQIDKLAEDFFSLVASKRPITVDALQAMQAGTVYGQQALEMGLCDQIATYDQVIEILNSNSAISAALTTDAKDLPLKETNMKLDELKAALAKMVEEGEETEKEEAKKCLAALEPDGDEPEEKVDAVAAEEHTEPDGDEEKKEMKALKAEVVELQKAALLATRTDLSAERVEQLKKENLDTVKFAVKNLPVMTGPVASALAGLAAKPTIQANATPESTTSSDADERFINSKLGLRQGDVKPSLIKDGKYTIFTLPVMDTQSKAAYLKSRAAK